jgi:DNA-binding NtrC family response regulator
MARFLVVDDDPSTVSGMTHLLMSDGHDVSPFTSGAAAIDALSREHYDAVVTDLEMPHVDGHAVVRATRDHRPHSCLVVVTGKADDALHDLVSAGACIVADKPVEYEDVMKALADCRARGGPAGAGGCLMRSLQPEQQLLRGRRP